jgi:branched-chain amino acid transport system substrate-binding protein
MPCWKSIVTKPHRVTVPGPTALALCHSLGGIFMSRASRLFQRLSITFLLTATILPVAIGQGKTPPSIKIGEINSYKAYPAFLTPYRKGWQLALEQINAQGGVLGRQLEVVSRDDHGDPATALRHAQDLINKSKVSLLFGGYLSEPALALNQFSQQEKVFFLASAVMSDRLTWEQGHRYSYRLRPSSWMYMAALAPKALAQRKKRWALIYPNDEYGQSIASTFKAMMRSFQPKVEFVAEQAVTPGKWQAATVVKSLVQAEPEAIFNALFANDLHRFVHEGNVQQLFNNRVVVAVLAGEPEYLEPLGAQGPTGWIAAGYPLYAIDSPAHQAFLHSYRERYREAPRAGSVLGYAALMSIAAGLKKAGANDTEKLVDAFADLHVDTPYGPIRYRPLDHQSTLGVYIGTLGLQDGVPIMRDAVYANGIRLQPLDEQVRKMRPRPQ